MMIIATPGCGFNEIAMESKVRSNLEETDNIYKFIGVSLEEISLGESDVEIFNLKSDELSQIKGKPELQEKEDRTILAKESKEPREERNELEEDKDNIELLETIEVHFIDVGQGDSIFIKQGSNAMLIDAGDNQYGHIVVNYLIENGIDKLDYVIGTHPHSDHIGGLDDVIDFFSIGKVIMPKVTHNTETFDDLINSIQNKGLKISTPIVGDVYNLGDSKFTILAPNESFYENLNNYSVVIKLEYGNNSFVFTGDIESQSENQIVNNGLNINTDVLKIAHHGSNTSTSNQFLESVNPLFAIFMVGEENKYLHPDITVVNRLVEKNIEIFRTDLDGTIVAKGDGENIKFEVHKTQRERSEPKNPDIPSEVISYIGNKNSKIFHSPYCKTLPKEKNRTYFKSKEDAIEAGFRGCQNCNP